MALLVFLLLIQLVSVSGRRCPDGQIKHRLCCVPVWNCNEGHYVKKCERDGAEDECLKCPRGTNNPFNSSSFDIKHCYKSICKLSDSVAVSDTDCECDRSKGWFGENYLACQLKHGGCPPGKELTQKGKCERCTNFHYKDWHGLGFCKKHFDCEHLNLDEIMGNAIEPNKCIKKGIPIRVKPASGENKRPVELVTSTTSSSSPSPSLSTTTTKTKSTTQKNKETTSKVTQKTTPSERNVILKHVSVSPTKVSQNLPVVGNRDPTNIEATRNGRIEGILIVVVAILCFLLLLIFCIGTVAYIRRRLKSSPEVTIPNRPALPLPNDQPVQQVADTFAPPIYQSQRQTQPLLQPENPYLCMSGPNQSCIYALPASLHLSSAPNVNSSYRPPAFDNISTYGSQYVPSQIRPAPASPNSLGSQLTLQPRSEHLYMTLPAERSESEVTVQTKAQVFNLLFHYLNLPGSLKNQTTKFPDDENHSTSSAAHHGCISVQTGDDQVNLYAIFND